MTQAVEYVIDNPEWPGDEPWFAVDASVDWSPVIEWVEEYGDLIVTIRPSVEVGLDDPRADSAWWTCPGYALVEVGEPRAVRLSDLLREQGYSAS